MLSHTIQLYRPSNSSKRDYHRLNRQSIGPLRWHQQCRGNGRVIHNLDLSHLAALKSKSHLYYWTGKPTTILPSMVSMPVHSVLQPLRRDVNHYRSQRARKASKFTSLPLTAKINPPCRPLSPQMFNITGHPASTTLPLPLTPRPPQRHIHLRLACQIFLLHKHQAQVLA